MKSQNIRFLLLASLMSIGMMLYSLWDKEHRPSKMAVNVSSEEPKKDLLSLTAKEIPEVPSLSKQGSQQESSEGSILVDREISVKTDVLHFKIDRLGGDIIYLDLPAFPDDSGTKRENFILLDHSPKRFYVAQSGLVGEQGPDIHGIGRAKYESNAQNYELQTNQDRLDIVLKTTTGTGVVINKTFSVYRGKYIIDVVYLIDNHTALEYKGSLYARLKRKPETESGGGFLGIQTYTGAAVNTPKTPFKKLNFKDIADKPFSEEIENGWAAMVEHYFVSAWVPEAGIKYHYQTNVQSDGSYSVGFIAPAVAVLPNQQTSIQVKLYAGPEIMDTLEKIAPGLEHSVDYGILWPICVPIFWLLKKIYELIGNWGWSIVIITIVIKLLFYRLSAASYRSMGNMRKLQPKMEALKQRYGEDKQKYSQATMELYKKEKINPLGGCLPIVVQIPVFIALYYVLLGSVELRQAPFLLWITDLSVKDPFYVLPILMGITMLVQQKLNPAPPDPVQAKIMMLMPIIFTVLFVNFPSGLVLYWFVNNLLSIVQQWYITQNIEKTPVHGKK